MGGAEPGFTQHEAAPESRLSQAAAGLVLLSLSSTARGERSKTKGDGCNAADVWGFGFCLF